MTRTLIPGQTYHVPTLILAGWTDGDGSGHEGYRLGDYFDATGRYLGPDEHGIAPIAEPDPTLEHCAVCGRPLDEEDRCPMGEDAQHVSADAAGMTTYVAGISDGMSRNGGGETTIRAASVAAARAEAEEWADAGDYPCAPPVTVTLSLCVDGGIVERWEHQIPDSACSGDPDGQ